VRLSVGPDHFVTTITLNHIVTIILGSVVEKNTLDTTDAFDTTVAFVMPLVTLLTSSPVMIMMRHKNTFGILVYSTQYALPVLLNNEFVCHKSEIPDEVVCFKAWSKTTAFFLSLFSNVSSTAQIIQSIPQVHDHRRTLKFCKIRKSVKKEKLLQMIFQSGIGIFYLRRAVHGAALFTLSLIKSYGDVATLSCQRGNVT
jgi:hypothetical protein